MENFKRTFGDRLKQERKKLDMRQEDLAKKLGMTTATVRNWEQGRTWPEMPDFIRLCALFQCDADYLAGRIKQKTHDLTFLCAETGLSPEAIERLAEIKNGPFGGNDLDIVSKILTSPKLSDAIESVKDAKWAQDEVSDLINYGFGKNAQPSARDLAIEELPDKIRYLRAFRFEVTEAASRILNDCIHVDETLRQAQEIIDHLKKMEANNEH